MTNVRARIVHLSDLHISPFYRLRKTNRDLTDQLERIVCGSDPDVIAVTGDLVNHPLPFCFGPVARWLRNVVVKCRRKPELLVIPGNHDYKLFGVIGLRRISRIPFHVWFGRSDPPDGSTAAVRRSCSLLLNALWPWGKAMADELQYWQYPELGVELFGFNSTSLAQMFATGEVEFRILNELDSRISGSDSDRKKYIRIALVHHHPLPTLYRPRKKWYQISDSLMVFYNAGHFLRRMCEHNFDLVLHGHRHFSNLAFYTGGQDMPRLAVASAGTASAPATDDSRGHHFQVVEILDDDTVRLHSRFFSDAEARLDATTVHTLTSLEDVRRRRCRELSPKFKYSIGHVVKTVRITKDGYTDTRIDLSHCAAVSQDGVRFFPVELETGSPSYLRGVRSLSPEYARLEPTCGDFRRFKGRLDLGSEKREFSAAYCYRLMNGHALTRQEFRRKYGDSMVEYEYASLQCEGACELMTLEVEFPEGFAGEAPEVEVKYIPWGMRGMEIEDYGSLPDHPKEAGRAERYLSTEAGGINRVVLRCPNPVPDFIYRIKWRLKDELLPASPLQEEQFVAEGKLRLMRCLKEAIEGSEAELERYRRHRGTLDRLSDEICARLRLQFAGKLEISLMVFDETVRRLCIVCANYGDVERLHRKTFASGEGCAGFVFEKMRTLLYHPLRDENEYFLTPEEAGYGRNEDLPNRTLVCVPWVYGKGVVVGVVNIAGQQNSGLGGLFDKSPEEQVECIRELNALTNHYANAILKEEEVDGPAMGSKGSDG